MRVIDGVNRKDFKTYDTTKIRDEFLITELFVPNKATYTYTHIDRLIIGGIMPIDTELELESGSALRADYFLERREIGVINIGGDGLVFCDGKKYAVKSRDCLYIGRGTKSVKFQSTDKNTPAKFYLNSSPAHTCYPTTHVSLEQAIKVELGSKSECNERTIYKFILPQGVKSCQLTMGMTCLKDGSVWNTMPCHTHERRMEAYLYFNLMPNNVVFHFMGEPNETRHITIQNEEAVVSPSFSIHSGCGTSNYTFIWGMCGENQDFDDMDAVRTEDLR